MSFEIRRLDEVDIEKGYIELLGQLTTCEKITKEEMRIFCEGLGKNHQVWVIEDKGWIIGSGTLLIEKKIIHNMGKVGHIEDIVIDKEYRGKKLGEMMIRHLTDKSKEMGCYKVILDCEESKKGFYEKCGYYQKGYQMAYYI